MSTRSTRRPRSCRSKARTLDRSKDARFSMLETLADHDDELMEQLLEDIPPPRDKVFDDLAKELRDGLVCPVLMGVGDAHQRRAAAAEGAAPRGARASRATAKRLGVKPAATRSPMCSRRCTPPMAARCRSRACSPARSATAPRFITPEREAGRVSGVFKLLGQNTEKRGPAAAGETVALGKLESRQDRRHAHRPASRRMPPLAQVDAAIRRCWRSRSPPRSARTTSSSARRCNKLVDEDPSLIVVHNPETHEVVMWGQGEMHLRVATERLADRFGVAISTAAADASATARPSRSRSSSAAGTRSSPAATASSATWCSTSSRCRAAPASSSRTRSPAAWCRATTSRRSRRASSTRSSTARSASRWSTSR